MIFFWSTSGRSTIGCSALCARSASVATHRSASFTLLASRDKAASASLSLSFRSATMDSDTANSALAAASSAAAGERAARRGVGDARAGSDGFASGGRKGTGGVHGRSLAAALGRRGGSGRPRLHDEL